MKCTLAAVLIVCLLGLCTASAAESTIPRLRLATFHRLMQSHPSVVILACHEMDDDCQVGWLILRDIVDNISKIPGLDKIQFGFFPTSVEDAGLISKFGLVNGELNYIQNAKVRHTMPASRMKIPDAAVEFLQRCSMDVIHEYTSAEQFEEEVKSCGGELSTVVYFADGVHDAVEETLIKIFYQFENVFQMGAVRDTKLIKKLGAQPGQIKVYQCYDHTLNKEFTHDLEDQVDVAALRSWILHRGTPLVARANRDTVNRAVELFGECIVVAIPDDQPEIKDMLSRVAKALKGMVGFVWDTVEARKQHFIDVGATGNVFPSALGIVDLKAPPVVWDEKLPFTEQNLMEWAGAVANNEAQTFRKSAPIPEPQPNERVQSLVYENFMSTVEQKGKRGVLVLFYGTYDRCADCYSSMVSFKAFADHQSKSFPVDFYTYDISQNYAAQKITRLPELYLYKDDSIFRFPDRSFSPQSLMSWLHEEMRIPRHDEL